MEAVIIEATDRSPAVEFDFAGNTFRLSGESYPEDVSSFFGPIMEKLEQHLATLNDASVTFTFELIYFNSSSAKVLMELFDLLDGAAQRGNAVKITWIHEEDDDNMEELGEEFAEELEHAAFELVESKAD